MNHTKGLYSRKKNRLHKGDRVKQRARASRQFQRQSARPALAYRQRGAGLTCSQDFYAPETWHEPIGRDRIKISTDSPGKGYVHPVTAEDVRRRIEELPRRFTRNLEVVQFSRMTRKRALFPCYGMQWGPNIYLYPIEESLVETYMRPPQPQQLIEARMYGGQWYQEGNVWRLRWTQETIRDFYLNNVLIHEIGHIHDERNSNADDRERYADWFAVEYGYRASRGRRKGKTRSRSTG